MMRKRSPRIAPGANPPPSSEGDEAKRPTGLSDAPRRSASAAADGVARPVGSCDIEPAGAPQAGQKRLASGSTAEHEEQRIVQPRNLAHATSHVARAPRGTCACGRTGLRLGRMRASTASLIPRCALAPAARASSLGYFGTLLAPRAEVRTPRETPRSADRSRTRRASSLFTSGDLAR